MKPIATVLACACVLTLAACGRPPVESVAPTPETVAFLDVEAGDLSRCVNVEAVVVDAVAGMVAGSVDQAVRSQVRQGVDRCGRAAALIDPARFPAAQRPRAEACRSAFVGKMQAYTALSRALAAEGDFMAAQQGAREFLSGVRASTPLMKTCNRPVA
jgi:hypothetical protein